MRHRPWALALALAAGLTAAAARADAFALEPMNGHLSVGYAKLFVTDAPGGSFSFAAGVDLPAASRLRIGPEIGLHLLGTRTVVRGSQVATVDYSMFEAVLFAHWAPPGLGPVGRISIGPALIAAHAELSASSGGAAFGDLAVEDFAPGAGLDITLMSQRASPVRVGLELGGRIGFLEPENWSMLAARLAFHY